VPITDNLVTFNVAGAGKLIGVGNGDPTDQESDKGTSRKAFSGLCMAIAQSQKTAGSITVEASSPGLTPASATIATKSVALRPQMAAWEREVPKGPGVTGLWRPSQDGGTEIFVLRQSGSELTGSVEGIGVSWAGGYDAPLAITSGNVDGSNVSFNAGREAYAGMLSGDTIQLERTLNLGPRPQRTETESEGARPVIGPPPDGSDPSRSPVSRPPGPVQIVLRRVQR
jgi:beta-galactosidase